ncbi:hypothetical protein LX15_000084 [Streptoalloteichus tenebrarius]|uniref:Uncharacterized protein n=1 Tax=Streptoalloteichus tenebrarius (strain ATCC 17920 / DSM 40477 / JCM 4838 / CBS 697.72 / NBRC 16177 / NCIMB 11028 / NRRL B-12390 / A12253. 1 / ISP 5477) TaxID=1933 RepID=A0ABT1HLL0_STRSD|nr:hypothetical protein [Streptoalloteichus tenebrarius]MCP2256401.1 hypothetical protein [Streptoalloteichus tenebrarius]BFF04749.1 hypothetical protein GCM10020241_64240 [Streptoalloteichus tenebrarius]
MISTRRVSWIGSFLVWGFTLLPLFFGSRRAAARLVFLVTIDREVGQRPDGPSPDGLNGALLYLLTVSFLAARTLVPRRDDHQQRGGRV